MAPERRDLIRGIDQIAIPVHDLERAVEFYRDDLGLRFLFRTPTMAFLECGGVRLMLALPEGEEFDHPSSVVYFEAEALDRAFDELSDLGVTFETAPHRVADLERGELWMAFFRDPDQNLMAVTEVRPRSE